MEYITTHSPEETFQFGIQLSSRLSPGDVIALAGELGTGKTHLTKGICKGLGYTGEVTSPSFVKLHKYTASNNDSELTIYHADFYLVRSETDLMDLGLDELFGESDNIVILEWAQKFPQLVPKRRWWIEIEWTNGNETDRQIKLTS